jgi:DNA-directed RNA polymerase specialized sigma24 family protein
LALRYYDNLEYHTIASTLGLSLGNVKTLIHRGKIALAKRMREREEEREKIGWPVASNAGGTHALLLV